MGTSEIRSAPGEGDVRQREVIELLPAAVYACDANGRVTMFNEAAAALWGRRPKIGEELWCGSFRMFWPDGTRLPLDECPMAEAIQTGQPLTREAVIERPDGTCRSVIAHPRLLCDAEGNMTGAINVLVDITPQKEAERRKDEFLATLSHELRNPLAPIQTALEILSASGNDVKVLEQVRAVMERQLGQIVRLVDDLLDLSRIGRNRIELRRSRCDLAAVLHHSVETSRPVIDTHGHNLAVQLPQEPIYVDADLTRLAQVFANLLNNAAKYTARGGAISIGLVHEAGEAVVRVRDNGMGIPPDQLGHIFEMFAQVERSEDSVPGGLGIGLCIARRLVEMHGGTIVASSEGPARGSEFTVRLPTLKSAADMSAPRIETHATANRRRVLIADDNPDSAATLAMLVELLGNEVRVATNGEEAVAHAGEFHPTLALLDIGMPLLDGFEACRRIRALPHGRAMTIVALTGWGQADDRRRSREAGFDQHLVKPVDRADLEALLKTPYRDALPATVS